jgi:hypothetical protein
MLSPPSGAERREFSPQAQTNKSRTNKPQTKNAKRKSAIRSRCGEALFRLQRTTRARELRGLALHRLTSLRRQRQRLSFMRRGQVLARQSKEIHHLNDLTGYGVGRSDAAMLTACRKVRGMYRPHRAKSRRRMANDAMPQRHLARRSHPRPVLRFVAVGRRAFTRRTAALHPQPRSAHPLH